LAKEPKEPKKEPKEPKKEPKEPNLANDNKRPISVHPTTTRMHQMISHVLLPPKKRQSSVVLSDGKSTPKNSGRKISEQVALLQATYSKKENIIWFTAITIRQCNLVA